MSSRGVCTPKGFLASGVSSGMKRRSFAPGVPLLDLALIHSRVPCTAAGVTTTNQIVSPSVRLLRERLRHGQAQAIVVNAGSANCLVGPDGYRDARLLTHQVAKALKINEWLVLLASTGVIGRRLIIRKISQAIPALVLRLGQAGHRDAAAAILTTDTKPKEYAARATVAGQLIHIGGMAKGSGMIAPAMGTMLAFFTTDAAIPLVLLRAALHEVSEKTFHRVTIDGDTSTNDVVVILANGLASAVPIQTMRGQRIFTAALLEVAKAIAQMIARDGEGATKRIEVSVLGSRNEAEAVRVAKCVANSPLVKTMVAGADPNIGRIAACVGRSGVKIHPGRLLIDIGGVVALRHERILLEERSGIREALMRETVPIRIRLGLGRAKATVWTCDLTEGYVRINVGYTT